MSTHIPGGCCLCACRRQSRPIVAQTFPPAVVGRWDITVTAPGGSYPSWLEVRASGNRTLVGSVVGRVGSARPISKIEFADGRLRFPVPPQWEPGDGDFRFEAQLRERSADGTMVTSSGEQLSWTGVRAPLLRRATSPAWGAPVALFDGRDLAAWRSENTQWRVEQGVLTSKASGANLVTRQTFEDFTLHVEFRYPEAATAGSTCEDVTKSRSRTRAAASRRATTSEASTVSSRPARMPPDQPARGNHSTSRWSAAT